MGLKKTQFWKLNSTSGIGLGKSKWTEENRINCFHGLKKAFEVVNRNILLEKLEGQKLSEAIEKWIVDYLVEKKNKWLKFLITLNKMLKTTIEYRRVTF